MRTEYYSAPLEKFFYVISETCDKYGIVFIFGIIVTLFPREKNLSMMIASASVLGLNNMVKTINAEPRPFFLTS